MASSNENDKFWNWFKNNESQYFSMDFDNAAEVENLFNILGEKLGDIDPELTFEFGVLEDKRMDFVISAGGIASVFPKVTALVNSSPSLSRWRITAFRQKKDTATIKLGDLELNSDNIMVQLFTDKDKIGIVMFLPEYKETENQVFEQVGFLLLDQTLGEYTVGTKVGFVEFQEKDSKAKELIRLSDIPKYF
jgi:hypothetical protein